MATVRLILPLRRIGERSFSGVASVNGNRAYLAARSHQTCRPPDVRKPGEISRSSWTSQILRLIYSVTHGTLQKSHFSARLHLNGDPRARAKRPWNTHRN